MIAGPTESRPTVAARAGVGLTLVLLLISLGLSPARLWSPTPPPISKADLPLRINPNTATAAELHLLPHIGERIAETIVAYRASIAEPPAFRRPEDLARVPRIGPAIVDLARPYLAFPETSAEPE